MFTCPGNMPHAAKFITSSVVRGAQLGDSHGGLCVVDVTTGEISSLEDKATTAQIPLSGDARNAIRGLAVWPLEASTLRKSVTVHHPHERSNVRPMND